MLQFTGMLIGNAMPAGMPMHGLASLPVHLHVAMARQVPPLTDYLITYAMHLDQLLTARQ